MNDAGIIKKKKNPDAVACLGAFTSSYTRHPRRKGHICALIVTFGGGSGASFENNSPQGFVLLNASL